MYSSQRREMPKETLTPHPPTALTYSLVRLVLPNTEELISRPFTGLYKIRLLLQDCLTSRYLRFFLALLQLQLCLQLQQNTMVPVDVDGQICHFCSQRFVSEQIGNSDTDYFALIRPCISKELRHKCCKIYTWHLFCTSFVNMYFLICFSKRSL